MIKWALHDNPLVKKQYLLVLEEVTQLRMELRQLKGRSDRIDKMFGKLELLLGEDKPLESHSEPAVTSEGETGQHQITSFTDLDPGYGVTIKGSKDATFDTVQVEDSGLASFLARPTRIYETTWDNTTSPAVNDTFNPWKLFFENSTIADKIRFYNNLSCKLHVKFVINGNSFLYGRVMVSYEPLATSNQLPLSNFLFSDFILRSQRPKLLLNPTTNEGGTMDLPFMFPKNYMSIPNSEWDDMGEISLSDLNPLEHASGLAGAASITVYAWASDVVLTTPTALDSQSKQMSTGKKKKTMSTSKSSKSDEYGTGIISKPASAIAAGAGWLSNLPAIGPYARATQMVASGIGQAASLFGYSRPPVIEGPCTTKLISTSPFANTDRHDTVMKLSLDSKQEMTIDPRVAGADGEDHMGIYELIQKESLLTQFNWELPKEAGGNIVGDQLFAANITPSMSTTLDSGNTLFMTPMAWMSQMFQFWHGPIKLRFQVVASNFHKGRLLLTYDPNIFTETTENKVYSEVVDIAETTDFEVEIGWGNSAPWLNIGTVGQPLGSLHEEFVNDDTPLPFSNGRSNGQLVVTVLNELTTPGDESTAPGISVNVWVSAGDSMKFAVPIGTRIQDLSILPFESQSLLISHSDAGVDAKTDKSSMENKPGETMTLVVNAEANTDHTMEVFFGEHVVSLRDLFRRYVYHIPWKTPDEENDYNTTYLNAKVFPYYRGTLPFGVSGVYEYASSGTVYSTNPCCTIPLTYCAPAYMAWRGGIRKKILDNLDTYVDTAIRGVTRKPFTLELPGIRSEVYPNEINVIRRSAMARESFAGQELTMVRNTGMLETEFPYYQKSRFSSPRIYKPIEIQSDSYEYVQVTSNSGATTSRTNFIHEYVSTAEDFTLIYFINVPRMYRYELPYPD
jgi:hypothetical protein